MIVQYYIRIETESGKVVCANDESVEVESDKELWELQPVLVDNFNEDIKEALDTGRGLALNSSYWSKSGVTPKQRESFAFIPHYVLRKSICELRFR